MSCPLPPPSWWQDYVAGRLKTPRDLFRAAWAENPDPAQASDRFLDVPDPGPTWDAPERLKAPLHFKSEGYMRQRIRADYASTDPRLMVFGATLIQMAQKRQIPLYVHTALRSEAEQNKLKAAGNSKASYGRSPHNIGEALDIVHGVFHWQLNRSEWDLLHTLGRLALNNVNTHLKAANKLQLVWGGTFNSLYDPAHWEIADFRQRLRPLPRASEPVHLSPPTILARRADLLRGL